MRLLLLLIFTVACENIPQNLQRSHGEQFTRDDVYPAQELQMNINEIQRETSFEQIPDSDEVVSFLDQSLSPNYECDSYQTARLVNRNAPREVQNIVNENEVEEENNIQDTIKENFARLGGTPVAIDQALCFMNTHGDKNFQKKINGTHQGRTKIRNKDYMVVQDFTLSSGQKRFFLINMNTGEIETMFSSHGMGNQGGTHNGLYVPEHFSNQPGTNLSPRGFMVSGERAPSNQGWKWHMKFDGLQENINDNSRDRLVVFHPGVSRDGTRRLTYPGRATSNETDPVLHTWSETSNREIEGIPQNMTWGCTAVASEYAEDVYDKTKNGALFYNFTQTEKDAGPDYCGSDLLDI